jgi:curli biogenesis system outer membrane secretion channel CsgG
MIFKMKSKSTLVIVLSLLFLITACGGQQAKPDAQAEAQPQAQAQDPPLAKKYQNIVVRDLTSSSEIRKDYPEALQECQANLIGSLATQKAFKSVALAKPGKKFPARSLVVQTRVSDIHIVHGAARFWAGAFAGSSYMNLDLKLTDAATGKVVREKEISSSNNAWAAAWVGGSSDRTLPADMGKIVAGYIESIMPK